MTTETSNALPKVEYEYELWQDGVLQGAGREADYDSAKSESNHYAMMYSQDGPVEVHIYEKRILSTYKVQPKRRRYDPSGSLSEYGIFPECDAQPLEEGERDWLSEAMDSLAEERMDALEVGSEDGLQAEDAEPKTLPVPTRVYLIGETAVIAGTPQRGWGEDAHNCDAMGCATFGRHVLARVPFTDERAMSQQPAAGDGCHCGTCTCEPNMTPAVRFDLSPAQMEGAIRDHLIRLGWTPPDEHAVSQAAEIEALRAEVAEWKRVAAAQAELHGEAEERAERLAVASRQLVGMYERATGLPCPPQLRRALATIPQKPTT